MASRTLTVAALAVLLATLAVWRPWEEAAVPQASSIPAPSAKPERAAENITDKADPAVTPVAGAQPPPTPPPVLSGGDLQKVRDAIDNLEFTLRDYAAALRGNPVGTNSEITAALILGDNEKQLKLEIPGGSTINDKGELCDPWGSPWFFHQLSAEKTEIRSAGPDKEMYSADDFVR